MSIPRPPRPVLLVAAVALASTALSACLDLSVQENRPLTLTLSVDRSSAQVGDSLEFFFEAEGNGLAGVLLNFGDGEVDEISTAFASTASSRVKHAYDAPGTYRAQARVDEATGRSLFSDTVVVTITATP